MDRFDNRMRFEWADPEQRVLLYSWGFAILIAILWLITVALYKITPKPFFPDDSVEIELTPTPNVPQPPETKTAAGETDVTREGDPEAQAERGAEGDEQCRSNRFRIRHRKQPWIGRHNG